jgi:hypothetical protein
LVARMRLNQARGMQGVDVWLPARPLELGPARAKVPPELGSRHVSKSAVSAEPGSPLKALCLVLVISDNAQVLVMCLRLYVAKDD